MDNKERILSSPDDHLLIGPKLPQPSQLPNSPNAEKTDIQTLVGFKGPDLPQYLIEQPTPNQITPEEEDEDDEDLIGPSFSEYVKKQATTNQITPEEEDEDDDFIGPALPNQSDQHDDYLERLFVLKQENEVKIIFNLLVSYTVYASYLS